MAEEKVTRKLAAILYADVVGYSRLTGVDEEGTHRIVAEYLDAMAGMISDHGGHVVHYAGDAVLADFTSVVAAVECAVEVQNELATRSAAILNDRKVQFRIGVNIGDVIVDRDDIYGNGVNVAARLESIAEPGGICVSASVFEQVKGKLDVGFEDIGPQEVKNIAEPLQAYRVVLESSFASNSPPPFPDKPSIAVLPFDNMSGDPEQEFFADGMAEDIITGLSKFRWLFVIARNSTFTYKGRASNVKAVARDLGVRYVLEGSVRRSDARIRVTGQLINAEAGTHIWAERYDRKIEDLFTVQDEITEAIVQAIGPEIGQAERDRARRKPPSSLDAWGLYQRGLTAYHSATGTDMEAAIELFDNLIERDPTFAPAFAMAAASRCRYVLQFEFENRDEVLSQAQEMALKGITLDPQDSICLWADSRVHSMCGRHDVAIAKAEQAVALNPNDAMARYSLALVLGAAGRLDDALSHVDYAMRLSPRDIAISGSLTFRAFLLFDLERYEEALENARIAIRSPNPRIVAFETIAASLIKLGRQKEAKKAIDDYLAFKPDTSLEFVSERPWIGRPETKARYLGALQDAGLS